MSRAETLCWTDNGSHLAMRPACRVPARRTGLQRQRAGPEGQAAGGSRRSDRAVALIVAARKAGLDGDAVKKRLPRVDAIPFESQHSSWPRCTMTRTRRKLVYLKGAVEVVLDRCNVAFNTRRQPIELDRECIQKHVG